MPPSAGQLGILSFCLSSSSLTPAARRYLDYPMSYYADDTLLYLREEPEKRGQSFKVQAFLPCLFQHFLSLF